MSLVIYLTGAPAAGKSTLVRRLRERDPRIDCFEYGREMAAHLRASGSPIDLTQQTLRSGTSGVVSPNDILMVNRRMMEWVDDNDGERDLIIDSHQVTLEHYGFRIAPFSADDLKRLRLSEIWVLSASPAATIERIAESLHGHRMPTQYQAYTHAFLQASLALTYATRLDIEVHVFDTEAGGEEEVLGAAVERLKQLRKPSAVPTP